MSAEVSEDNDGLIARPHVDAAARRRLETEYLGLPVLATNREDWTTAQITEAYRGKAYVELVFRNLKDPRVSAFRPQHHWTDQKIRVHALIVVLGQILGRVLLRRATLIYAPPKGTKGGRRRTREQLEHGEDDELARLAEALTAPVAYGRAGKSKWRQQIARVSL